LLGRGFPFAGRVRYSWCPSANVSFFVASACVVRSVQFNTFLSDCDKFTICCVIICCLPAKEKARSLAYAALNACLLTQMGLELQDQENMRIQAQAGKVAIAMVTNTAQVVPMPAPAVVTMQ
jgi:hypothetical protein